MTSFYTKNTKNLDMFRAIQDSLLQLQVWHADPTPMLECQKDILNQAVGGTEAITSDLSLTTCTFIMKPILSAVISVFERQFRPFLEGEFINPSPEDFERASNAISHNMAAERILGLTDNLLRKAPNASGEFLSGKIRFRLNKTHDWLASHDDNSRLSTFVISEGYKAERDSREASKILHRELDQRRGAVKQSREDAMRKSLSAEIQELIVNPPAVGTVPAQFKELPADIIEKLCHVLNHHDFLSGQLIRHNWYEDGQVTPYFGRLHNSKVKTVRKISKVVIPITYWPLTSIEAEATERPESLFLSDFITDVMTKDLHFID